MKEQNNPVLQALIFNALWVIWKSRNKAMFHNRRNSVVQCIRKIKKAMVKSDFLFTGTLDNTVALSMFIRSLNLTPRHRASISHKEVRWACRPPGWHKYISHSFQMAFAT